MSQAASAQHCAHNFYSTIDSELRALDLNRESPDSRNLVALDPNRISSPIGTAMFLKKAARCMNRAVPAQPGCGDTMFYGRPATPLEGVPPPPAQLLLTAVGGRAEWGTPIARRPATTPFIGTGP